MDKQTLSNYGWIVVTVLVLSVMLALATPFGEFVAGGFRATYEGFAHTSDKAFEVIGLSNGGSGETGGEQGGTQTPDNQETVYEANHLYVHTPTAWTSYTDVDETFGLTSADGLSPYAIIDEAQSNMVDDGHWNGNGSYWDDTERCFIVPEADFKAYAEKSFVSISDAQWNAVKNVSTGAYQFKYENGNFVFQMMASSWSIDYSDKIISYVNNGETFDVYGAIMKKNEVENPYNLFNESDYGSYDEYDAAVQQYMTANGIDYNGLDDYYYTESVLFNYVITYQCEGLTNVKVYADRITSTDAVLETNLKIKTMKIVDATTGSALAQPSQRAVHYYGYQKIIGQGTASDGSTYDEYAFWTFKVYADAPTVAIADEWNDAVPCGCNEFTFSNGTVTCKCGSFVLGANEYSYDYENMENVYN